jgi:hypothetical protein
MKNKKKIKIGDSVKVKAGVIDPDFDISIEGWQGRITEVFDNEMATIQWDSITLENMPESVIEDSEVEGLDWAKMTLQFDEMEIVQPRDSKKDVEKKVAALQNKFAYSSFGEQGKRITKVLENIDLEDYWECMNAWGDYFEKVLTFPFKAFVAEFADEGPLDWKDKVTVERIITVDDLYGVIVKVRAGRNIYHYPLCDLEATDKKSENYQHLRDYAVWFANH